jgi:hypothetical protein
VSRHRRIDQIRNGHRLRVQEELAFLSAGHHLEVVDQPAEALTLPSQGVERLLVAGQHAFTYGFDGRANGGDRSSQLVSELTGELPPGLLRGLEPIGELVDRDRERGDSGPIWGSTARASSRPSARRLAT